jgi:predicted dehydrogenase
MQIALVGLGTAGCDIHLPALAGIPSASIVGLCDADSARRDRAAALCGAPTFADFDDLLAQVRPEVVVVATPPDSHADYCVRSLAAGAHVLCEKPFVSSVAEADNVLNAAARAGRRVALNHEFREMPIFRALRDQLTRPGSPSLMFLQMWQLMDLPPHAEADWRRQLVQRTLFEAGVHLVDLAMTLFGEIPVSVQASIYGGEHRASDAVAIATLEFSGGRLAHLTQNRLCKGETQYFEVRADTPEASFRASFGGRARVSAGLFRGTTPHVRFEFGRSGIAWKEIGNRRSFLARNPKDPTVMATRLVIANTLAAFRAGTEAPTSGRLARDILRVIVACYHSAASGQRVRLDDPLMQDLSLIRMGA